MVRGATLIVLAVAAVLTFASGVEAQERGGKGKKAKSGVEARQTVGFTVQERRIIVEYFAERGHSAEALPPGIAKNLARGKPLPPGIAKKRIPAELQARLPERAGIEVTIFGDRIVLLEASGVVVDILEGIFG